eukprot:m.136676 g.136676  ORF g.136676 m.136676 type:complete len:150 (-) comp10821_c0_seq1:193-642(-)
MEISVEESFELFQDKGKKVSKKDIHMIVRSQHLCPTDAEINAAISSAGIADKASLGDVKKVISSLRHTKNDDIEGTIRRALKLFDTTGGDVAAVSEISHALQNIGSKMSVEDIDEIFRQADVDAFGQVEIDEFARLIMGVLGEEEQASA